MRTIRTKLYSFNELNNEAKEIAIKNYRENNSSIYMDFFIDNCIEQAVEIGFEYIELQYSLGYSQGDGLSFGAQNCTVIEKLIFEILGEGKENTAKLLSENSSFSLQGNKGRNCFASKSDIDFYFDFSSNLQNTDNIDKLQENVLEKLQSIYMDLCFKLEKQGYTEIEFQKSDEYITEDILSNDFEFLINGQLF